MESQQAHSNPVQPVNKSTTSQTSPGQEVKDKSPRNQNDAFAIFQQGVARLRGNQLEKAVKILGKACEAGMKQLGEKHPEFAQFLYRYASALVASYQASVYDNVLGSAVPSQIPVQQSANSSQQESDQKSQGEQKPAQEQQEKTEQNNLQEVEDEKTEEKKEISQIQQEKQVQNEPSDDLEYAWQNLEVARKIAQEHGKSQLLLQIHEKIAQLLGLKQDFKACVEEYKKVMQLIVEKEGEIPSRIKAENFFFQGTYALLQPGEEDFSIQCFSNALVELQEYKKTCEPEQAKELQGIIEELLIKREDAIEQKESARKLQQEPTEQSGFGIPTTDVVQDLGVLGKRKREEPQGQYNQEQKTDFPSGNDLKRFRPNPEQI